MERWEYIKKSAVHWRGGYCGYFLPTESPRDSKRQLRTVTWPIHRWNCRRNHRGIQNGSSVRWRALFIIRRADRITDRIVPSVKPSTKVNILLTLSSPISPSSSPSQLSPTANNQPPQKISLFSAQQVIFLEVFSSQHPCSDLPTVFYQFL